MPDQDPERRALLQSIVATASLGVLGILWGIAVGSQMILFDGAFGLVGILVSAMLLRASSLADRPPSRAFPYGRQSATPLVIGVQGLVLLVTLGYAAIEAITIIRIGGSDFAPGFAVLYGVVAAGVSLAFAVWLRRSVDHSDLVDAEATAWRVGGLRGVGMVIGFTLMLVLERTAWDAVVPYVDPVMVLLTCVLFVRPPLQMVRSTIHELLEGAPSAAVQAPVLAAIAAVQRHFEIDEPIIRMTKVGPKLYVEVDAYVAPDVTVSLEHEVRTALERRLRELPYEIWLNLELLPKPAPAAANRPASTERSVP
jgi:cation diffusion facilitator family transporter